jgi:hypothetical protein
VPELIALYVWGRTVRHGAGGLPWGMIYQPTSRDLTQITDVVSVVGACIIIVLFLAYYALR